MSLKSMISCLSVLLLLLLVVNEFETTFVTLGDYSQYSKYGINDWECGLKYSPVYTRTISYSEQCFENKYPNKTVYGFTHNDKTEYQLVESRVFLGEWAQDGEAPWVVRIYTDSWIKDENPCTGVLLTFKWVLTAAHCKRDKPVLGGDIVISAGSNKADRGTRSTNPKWFPHPKYDPKNETKTEEQMYIKVENDIALIKLDKPFVRETEGHIYLINTICLPSRSKTMNERAEERATFFGWGFWDSTDKVTKHLLRGEFVLEPYKKCYSLALCARHNDTYTGPRTCNGDSGGPLVQYVDVKNLSKAVIIGTLHGGTNVQGRGANCQKSKLPDSIWVAIPKHIDWILNIIKYNN